MATTFDPNRVGPGTFQLVRDASTGTYSIQEVGFTKLPSLTLPDLTPTTTTTPTTQPHHYTPVDPKTQSTPDSGRTQITSSNGVPMTTYTTYETSIPIHPDHSGFVVGTRGATIRGVAAKHKVDARMRKTNDGSWPKVVIRGKMEGVEAAFMEIQHIANIANIKIPRINT